MTTRIDPGQNVIVGTYKEMDLMLSLSQKGFPWLLTSGKAIKNESESFTAFRDLRFVRLQKQIERGKDFEGFQSKDETLWLSVLARSNAVR